MASLRCTAALILAGALTGCATTGTDLRTTGAADLATAPMCCGGTLAQAKKTPLPKEPVSIAIDKTAQAFDFGGNKAFFVLYELPPLRAGYSVTLTSHAAGTLHDSALFVPRVAIYDAAFKPTRFFDEKTLRQRGREFERTIFFNPRDGHERYLVVFGGDLSAPIESSYAVVTAVPIIAGPVIFTMVSGQESKSMLHASPVGQVSLVVAMPQESAAK